MIPDRNGWRDGAHRGPEKAFMVRIWMSAYGTIVDSTLFGRLKR